MTQWTINTAIVLNQTSGQVALDLAGQTVQVVVRGTTTPYPIIETGSLDPIPSSLLTVSPIGTLPPFIIDTDTPEDLYLDWRDSGSGAQGGIGFEEVMRTIAVQARDAAADAIVQAEAAQEAAVVAQTAAAGAVTAATTAIAGIPAQIGTQVVAAVTAQVAAAVEPVATSAQAAATSAVASQLAAEVAASTAAGLASGVVRSVNGLPPNAAGNVTVATGGGGSGGAVDAVNGHTGYVVLDADDVGARPAGVAIPVADIAATGTPSGSTYLRGDGTWSTPAGGGGSGAVDSVNGQTGDVTLAAADVGALPSSTVYVASVAGKTGTVSLTKGDVGLSQVDNTSDANKPLSTAAAAALAGKAEAGAVVFNTGNQTVGGTKTFTSAPVVPDNAFPIAKVSGLSATLASLVAGMGITAIVAITQSAYEALPVKSATTLYVITE
ncbi:hypothetical protein Xcel_0514 [Xylanimonas cellulosilytica DSM 15894]|uniref:Minor tail protein gp31 C-terminal domain-containing protein n=1 Tax=Xylanimonas cellulosilytica (strain DSM 15894 / JCM 12276 / CECT 5975 / KCTC 9989 / LMG 20990 / NBRC 107835 / XIL07) TaxID=446471 RepID=D1BW50_XYLCX|nr:hypothetical protein [Xylanimonas cellulosilytica]ACZ29553.1 hypothetical protein Xcel_0514 [Xylanimonas cellulosilytica DSM 15894]